MRLMVESVHRRASTHATNARTRNVDTSRFLRSVRAQDRYNGTMGNKAPAAIPPRPPLTDPKKTRICVIGFSTSHNVGRAAKLANAIAASYPGKYETWFYFNGDFRNEPGGLLQAVKKELDPEQQEQFRSHRSAPFCWLETMDKKIAKGGRDRLCEWAAKEFPDNAEIQTLATTAPAIFSNDLFPTKFKPTTQAPNEALPQSFGNKTKASRRDSVAVTKARLEKNKGRQKETTPSTMKVEVYE